MAKQQGEQDKKARNLPATDGEAPATRVPEAGEPAPDFTLPSGEGTPVHLADLRGKRVILYFYPKDDTPGCTAEACSFRDAWQELQDEDVVVLGISKDTPRSHARFADKYGLPFTLLSDEDHAVAEQYGVWQRKLHYGRPYMGMARTTFYIRPNGLIGHVWENVKAAGHAQKVLEYLRKA
ncbi:MAG TPA: thioredoxin-dependent thiol peroxidase [Ktedonobacterales bacterium]|nr:thioredoxin-dependent thiol peroxidase [Ktedonobacterales bacterium]